MLDKEDLMKKKQIDYFFRELDKELGLKAEVILIGASAGSLMGHIRPSVDIDFEIRCAKKNINKEQLAQKIQKTAEKASVAAQYSEDVSHWSMISYLDYRKTALPYKKFGKLNVKLIAPEYWTIGKMARYHVMDTDDIATIIKLKKIKPDSLLKVWKRAIDSSDLCLELGHFKKHAIDFLKTRGRKLWGKNFDYRVYEKKLG